MKTRTTDCPEWQQPNEDVDDSKIQAILAAWERGEDVTPIVVWGEIALTGSHRIAALRRAYRDELPGKIVAYDVTAECARLAGMQNTTEWDNDDWIDALYRQAIADDNDELVTALTDGYLRKEAT